MPKSTVNHKQRMIASNTSNWSDGLSSLDIASLTKNYCIGECSPAQAVEDIFIRIGARGADGVWTYLLPQQEVLLRAAQLEQIDLDKRAGFPPPNYFSG